MLTFAIDARYRTFQEKREGKMARPKTGDKPGAIRQATVDEVSAVGSTAVSVNKVADRAGVSVGTIYRYYRTKDDLLFDVFLQVKRDLHSTMMAAAGDKVGAEARLKAMWFALVDYGFRAPGDFLLVELLSSETKPPFLEHEELRSINATVPAEIQSGIDDGTFVQTNASTIETVLASPAITLARQAYISGERIRQDEVERVFRLIWRGISRDRSDI
ncbi:TetR/AcrR family transcriptional regulator [Thalassococcus sp. S3]|uniref:TetR/AcrR family transcriptional regulator n=1 Tax=Thalassococcus sp. S3 TaxID=2017482 RepID=UPI00102B7ABA|nr:TetR/AcrR family transcriptional regulator [Thalassococcus sp. S3]